MAVLIIGDYTTRIGDPSGRSAERPILTDEEIDANTQDLPRAGDDRPPDPDAQEVRCNGEWLSTLSYADVVRLARTVTVARMLERDDFEKRFRAREPISVSELLYPLMQAYDSVAVRGRRRARGHGPALQPAHGPRRHAALRPRAAGDPDDADPELVGRDEDELVGRQQHPADRAARRRCSGGRCGSRTISFPNWWQPRRRSGRAPAGDPMEQKLALARWIVAARTGEEAARAAEEHFTRVVRRHEAPEELAEVAIPGRRPGPPAGAPR